MTQIRNPRTPTPGAVDILSVPAMPADIGQNQMVAPYPRGDTPARTTNHLDLEKEAVR